MKGAAVSDLWADRDSHQPRLVAREYSENATVHGLKYAVNSSHGKTRRLVWVIAFVGALSGLVYTLVIQLVGLAANPTRTYQTIEARASLPFPAVTLCNLNQFPKHLVEKDETLRQLLLATSSLSTVLNVNVSSLSNRSFSEDSFANIIPEVWPTLQWCSWDNTVQNCSQLFVTQKTDFGYCFTFNGRNGSNTPRKVSTRPGTRYGLSVIANIFQEQYVLGHTTDAAGMRVLLHDTEETPLVDGRGFDLSPGAATKVSLSMTKVTNLPPPYTTLTGVSCINTTQNSFVNSLKYFDVYDSKACIFECRFDFVVSRCHCKSLNDPGSAPMCSPLKLISCYWRVFESFDDAILSRNCSCPVPCEMNLFTPQLSMAAYPSLALMQEANTIYNLNLTEEEYRRDVLKINIAYDSFMLQSVVQVAEFSLESVVSTLGGQMGMFLGASIISIVEFLDFLLQLLLSKCPGSAAKKN